MGDRPRAGRLAHVPNWLWCLLAIAAAVTLANLPFVAGIFHTDPLPELSGLATRIRHGVLPGSWSIDPNIGFTAQALGRRAVLDWLHGRVPWWNPYEGAGTPLAGGMQSAAFFPFSVLLLLRNGQLWFHMALELTGGAGTWLLLRKLGVRDWLSTVGGIAFALNGTYAWFGHAAVNPVAFAPWLLAGVEHVYQRVGERDRAGWRLIAGALSLSIYAGFPETAFISSVFVGGWAVMRVVSLRGADRLVFAKRLVLGGAVGMLLSAPILIAFLTYLPNALVAGHFAAIAKGHLHAEAAATAVMPYFFGPIFAHGIGRPLVELWGGIGGYVTCTLVVLAIVAVIAKGRRPERLYLGAWALGALLITYGVPVSFGSVIGAIPLLRNTAFFRYAPVTWELAIVVLAVMGLDEIQRRRSAGGRLLIAAGAALAVVATVVVAGRPIIDSLRDATLRSFGRASLAWAIVSVAAVAGAGFLRSPRLRAGLVAAMLLLDVGAMFVVPEFSALRSATIDTTPVVFLQRNLGLARFATLGPIQPNFGSPWAIASVNGNDLPVPRDWARYVHRNLDQWTNPVTFIGTAGGRPPHVPSPATEVLTHIEGFRRAGVRYVVTPRVMRLNDSELTLVFASPVARIYRIERTNPYFTVIEDVCRTRVRTREALNVTCRRPATLIRRELFMPGWRATIGTRAAPIRKFDGVFQSVELPQGRNDVAFAFRPPGATLGWLALLAALAAMAPVWPSYPLRRISTAIREGSARARRR